MKNSIKYFLACVASLCAGGVLAAETISLNGDWSLEAFPQPEDGAIRTLPLPANLRITAVPAKVPGCCEMDLVAAGLLPDPLVSTNAFAFRAWQGHQWLYTKKFTAPRRAAAGERCVLVFGGIDTLADVFLNGEKIGSPENMLIPHEYDVTGKLKEGGENTVQVLIRSVLLASRDVTLGERGYTMSGTTTHEAFRKAPYMYGWDTMPNLPVSGIWRDVRLEVRPAVRVEETVWFVQNMSVAKRHAYVGVRCRISAPFERYFHANVRCTLSRNGKMAATTERPLLSPHLRFGMGVSNADFWWPRGMGEAALYDAVVEVVAEDGSVLARDTRKIGLRTVALEYDDRKLPERPGRFLFKINGEPVFVRGTDWIPLDPIPSRQKEQIPQALALAADLNCNLIRVWGGGVYEPEEFFAGCDELGLMVWQDFMMACTVPPQGEYFAEAIRKEVRSVVMQFRNHPSIVLWAGDNENDMAATWGVGRELAWDPNKNRITRHVIPEVLDEFDVTRPYLPSSPYISPDAHAKKVEAAEDHLWSGPRAWWKTPYYTDNPCWFCSEGGGHAIPCRSTFEKMMPPEDVERIWTNPDVKNWRKLEWTPQWRYRATCPNLEPNTYPWNRNDLILKQTAALFGDVPRNLDMLIEQSQSAQVESIKFQMELFRSQKFTKKGGFVVWNLRDGWPTISDAVSDYYGNKKKSYYALKAAQQTVLAMVTDGHRLLIVNDSREPVKGHVKVTDAATGNVAYDGDYNAPANGVLDLAELKWSGQGVLKIVYTAPGGTFRNHYLYGEPPFAWEAFSKWMKD